MTTWLLSARCIELLYEYDVNVPAINDMIDEIGSSRRWNTLLGVVIAGWADIEGWIGAVRSSTLSLS